ICSPHPRAHLAGPGGRIFRAAQVVRNLLQLCLSSFPTPPPPRRRRTWAMEARAAAPLVFFLLPGDPLLPAWPGQQVGRQEALEGHLYCAGAESGSGGAHVQQPRYFCPPHPPGITLLWTFTYFLSSPRTATTCVLLLPGGKGRKARAQHARPCHPLPAGTSPQASFILPLIWSFLDQFIPDQYHER
ncbi:hypothetical protein E2320_017402, partial [Naja naja]